MVGTFVTFLGLLALFVMLANLQNSQKNAYIDQAHQILGQGINPTNLDRAIELLLAIESDYAPESSIVVGKLGIRFWVYLLLWILLITSISITPRVVLGIWDGKRALERWRAWLRFCSVSVPGYVLVSVFLPWILRLLGVGPSSR